MFQGMQKTHRPRQTTQYVINFYILHIILLHASSNILSFCNLQHEYKPNVQPMVIWVLGTRNLGHFKCKFVLSVITKCLFICSNRSLWKHPI